MSPQTSDIIDELTLGILILQDAETALPLELTEVAAQVTGPLASVTVTQHFRNPFEKPVELKYLFPLPHEAAIFDYEIRIGERVIRAEIEEIEEARRTYERAMREGQRAGLLEQRRPNLFSMELAHVQPGEPIVTTIRYQQRVRYDDGDYEFVFPMGITPKYHADPSETHAVDAPIASETEPIGPVKMQVAIDGAGSTDDPRSPSHSIRVRRQDERRITVDLDGEVIPNKDFVLRYRVAEESVRALAWVSRSEGQSTVLVTAIPPRLSEENATPPPREFVFVLDRSGSMSRQPITQARNALRACLRTLGPDDTFMIQAFDNEIEWFKKKPCPVTQKTVDEADGWLGGVEARGGTDIVKALDAVLNLKTDRERPRYLVFLTDGAVSSEEVALKRIQKKLGRSRLFTFGIGSSVNRALLAHMAELGRGTVEYLQVDEDIEDALIRFQDRVSYPVMQDIELNWKGCKTWDVFPDVLPDLYIGQPLELVAKIAPMGSMPGSLEITGHLEEEPVKMKIDLPATTVPEPVVDRAWARARVDNLLDTARNDHRVTDRVRSDVISLGLSYRLLTPWTSFVAVDSGRASEDAEDLETVRVALPLPEGLDLPGFTATFSRAHAAYPMASASFGSSRMPPAGSAMQGLLHEHTLSRCGTIEGVSRLGMLDAMPDSATLHILARTQNVSGSWGKGDQEMEKTLAALTEFLNEGQTPRSGHYRRQLAKAATWLINATPTESTARPRAEMLKGLAKETGEERYARAAQKAYADLIDPGSGLAPDDERLLGDFEGYVTIGKLRAEGLERIPAQPGVYAVLLPDNFRPEILERSPGDRFKDQDPPVPAARLEREWVDGTRILYIGRAGNRNGGQNLRERIKELLDSGGDKPVAHWGDQILWRLKGNDSLLIAWSPVAGAPEVVEHKLLEQFESLHGKLPFANLKH
jgi:Ca-activated chloride channel family protein